MLPPGEVPRGPRIFLLFTSGLKPSTAVQVRRAIANTACRLLERHIAPYGGHIGQKAATQHFYPHSLIAALQETARNDVDALTRHFALKALQAAGFA